MTYLKTLGVAITTLALAGFPVLTAAAAAAEPTIIAQGPAEQPRTDRYVLRTEAIDHDFLVEVTAPPVEIGPGQTFPAVYALDGGYNLVGPTAYVLSEGRAAAPTFVVAIGYPNPLGIAAGPRETDMAFEARQAGPGGQMVGGGGGRFEAFLLDELGPFLEARYAIDPEKTVLIGHSQSALFGATILVNRPESFGGYILGSIPVRFAPALKAQAEEAAQRGDGRRVFIGFAPEDVAAFEADQLAQHLTGEGSTFVVQQRAFEGQTHLSSFALLASEGLAFVLPPSMAPAPVQPTAVDVDAATLDRLTGVYRPSRGMDATVSRQDSALLINFLGRTSPLTPTSEREFFIPGSDTRFAFEVDPTGSATSLTVYANGAVAIAPRVD